MKQFSDKIILSGHRGERTVVPENTMAAFRYALECGVDMIETDFHLSGDGHLVLIHDHTLDRTTDGAGFVRDCTLEELRALSAGVKFSEGIIGKNGSPRQRSFLRSPPTRIFCLISNLRYIPPTRVNAPLNRRKNSSPC